MKDDYFATKHFSDIQEKSLVKKLGGKLTPASGGSKFSGGDVITKDFLIEAKTSMKEKKSFSIKKSWLWKIEEQAYEQGRDRWSLAFRFEPKGEDYFVISEKEFIEYMELLNKDLH